ncbi:three-Cys-motif partner protein TcmP [Sphingomonas radiodurans]|uniref:three-Cys-motif partner protein TcmP n=1 Tax=Sphingomonas radiodurans TaxID=2890321 RepID=UPI001E4CFE7B|nr:three-Cys-motif partner protein TcmP [Sphingomonas radiodurans]WBH16026.1 three-Cys-motif partner protein TcmP [Sphingomonas radiodurans]
MTTTFAPPVPPEYVGREQAYIKHLFLRQYLGRLVHKIGSFADHIVYVDGFSGPWKSGAENYSDTSFGIALKSLTEASDYWSGAASRSRNVKMSAHLVERNASAFLQLQGIGSHFPAVQVTPYKDDFLDVVADIAGTIPAGAFSFSLIDPKGFALDMARLKPLLSRERSEVVFNFMFDFANRFTNLPQLQPTFDRLFVGVNWRDELNRLEADPASTPEARKRAFLRWFKEAVRNVGGFRYVADVEVQYPGKSRTFYYLVYGTRKPPGIEVFRDCQIKALEEQAAVAGRMQIQAITSTGQGFLFGPPEPSRDLRLDAALARERVAAREMMLRMIPLGDTGIAWEHVWPNVLSEHVVSRSALGREVNALRKARVLSVPAWTSNRKQLPDDSYRISRGNAWPRP